MAEFRAGKIEKKHNKSQELVCRYRRAFTIGIGYLLEEVPCLLSSNGLTTLELLGPTDMEIMQFFRLLRSCLAKVESGSCLHGDLCAMVARVPWLPWFAAFCLVTRALRPALRRPPSVSCVSAPLNGPQKKMFCRTGCPLCQRILPRTSSKLFKRRGLPSCIMRAFG